jgi:hypothetical protein
MGFLPSVPRPVNKNQDDQDGGKAAQDEILLGAEY